MAEERNRDRENQDGGHHAGPSSQSSQEDFFKRLTSCQRAIVNLNVAVLGQHIVQARKLATTLRGVNVDQVWREVAEILALDNPMEQKLAGPLHHAALSGYKQMCQMLISKCKCDINAATSEGATPLLYALNRERNEAVIKYLIDSRADPNKADNAGITPLHIASTKGLYEIAELLLSKGAKVDPLCYQYGESPLFRAAMQGNDNIVRLLLKHNADCNIVSKEMLTPLIMSLHGASLSCLEILIEAGADVNPIGCSFPPLALAADKGLDQCIDCLLKNGANPNAPDDDDKVPVQIAAMKGWERCVEILLPHSPHYEGLTVSEVVQKERNECLSRINNAIEKGDAAYWRKEYDLALNLYKKAADLGLRDPAICAKISLCHLNLHAQLEYIEEAKNYMSMVKPDLSSESHAKKLVIDFARAWKKMQSASSSSLGSGEQSCSSSSLGSGERP